MHIKSADGFSPLHRAAFGGHLEAVKILVKVRMFVFFLFFLKFPPLLSFIIKKSNVHA